MTALTITDSDGDFVELRRVGGGARYCVDVTSESDGVVDLTEDDLRSIRKWIDERLGDKAEGEKVNFDVIPPWNVGTLTIQPEPVRYIFGVPEALVQGLVEAALKSGTEALASGR